MRYFMLAVLVIGCATMRVATDVDPTASFAGRTTYAWDFLPRDAGRGDPWVSSDLLTRRVVEAVDRELAAKGYRRVEEADEADFLVDFHAAVENRLTTEETWILHEGPTSRNPRSRIVSYREGTLILDVVDPETQRQIWRGWAIDVVDEGLDPEEIDRKVNEAVGRILGRFPPAH